MLKVWLPLTKDSKNQGLSEITKISNTDFTLKSGGKLGSQCQDLSKLVRLYCADLAGLKTFSYAFWYKPETSTSTVNWNDVIAFYDSAGGKFRLETSYSNAYMLSMHNNSSYKIIQDVSASYGNTLLLSSSNYSRDVWYHVAVTVKENSDVRAYINGELKCIIARADGSINGYFNLGEVDGNNKEDGSMNDVRIYDHALSPMEVKQISQGLVLHYPLSGIGGENLLTGTNNGGANWQWSMQVGDFTRAEETTLSGVKGCKFTRGSTAQSGWSVIYYNVVDESVFEPSTNYILSVDIYPSVSTSFIASIRRSNALDAFTTNSSTQSVIQNKWNHVRFNLTTVSTLPSSTGEVIYFQNMNSDTGVSYIFRNLKLEKGDKATPWCPNPSDSGYNLMGLNDNVEYDCSGFGNNGTRVGELNWSSNTPRYNTSLDITSDSCARYIWTSYFSNLTDKITLACWVYQTTTSATSGGNTTKNLFIAGQDRDYQIFGFGLRSTNGIACVYAGTTNNPEVALSSRINIVNGWHHLVATYDGTTVKIYVDGVLKNSANATGDLDWTQVSNAFVIGKMSHGYTLTESYFPFRGYISDVRLYATALSAEDVLSLYQLGGSIDSNGVFHTYEYVEG